MDKNTDKKSFTIVDNAILRNQELGLKERGLLVTLLSLPESWDYSVKGFTKILPQGKAEIGAAAKNLEKMGYLKRTYKRDKDGRIASIQWEITVNPTSGKQETEKREAEKPETEKRETEKEAHN